MSISGTEYFVSKTAAIQYYATYDYTAADVEKKIKEKEIVVGKKPFCPAGKKLIIKDSRYWLEDK